MIGVRDPKTFRLVPEGINPLGHFFDYWGTPILAGIALVVLLGLVYLWGNRAILRPLLRILAWAGSLVSIVGVVGWVLTIQVLAGHRSLDGDLQPGVYLFTYVCFLVLGSGFDHGMVGPTTVEGCDRRPVAAMTFGEQPPVSFGGQGALVTGPGRGIGRAIALALAGTGAAVAVCARSEDEVIHVADEITQRKGKTFARRCDLSVRGHEKVLACGQIQVPACGQKEVLAGGRREAPAPR